MGVETAPHVGPSYLHGWGLLPEGSSLAGILLPGDLELLSGGGRRCKGFWDGRLLLLYLPFCLLLLEVATQNVHIVSFMVISMF